MNAVTWFEVPVIDMERAIAFYNKVFGWELQIIQAGPETMAFFPSTPQDTGAGGSLIKNEHYSPQQNGVLIYFHCEDVADQVGRVEEAGGTVLQSKKLITPEHGYMALALDSEGNRIAFHSRN